MSFRRVAGSFALLATGTCVALIFVELGLRALDISYPQFYSWDPQIGGVLRPGAEGWWRQEGNAYVKINRHGMRDEEHTVAKPPNTLRIAVLGDSYAEAFQVPQEKTFWAEMERQLGGCGTLAGREPEVLNFGVSGYGTAQELLMWRHRVERFQPDIVVLSVTTGNDVRNNSRTLERDPAKPYFVLRDGTLVLDDAYRRDTGAVTRQSAAYRLLQDLGQHMRVLQVANRSRQIYQARQQMEQIERASEGRETRGADAALDLLVYREPVDATWEEAWRVTERLIVQLRDEAASSGATLHVVTLTSGSQVHPDAHVRDRVASSLGVETLDYADERIRALGVRAGFPVLTLAQPLRDLAVRTGAYLHGFGSTVGAGHWNELGHEQAGRIVAAHLCAERPASE